MSNQSVHTVTKKSSFYSTSPQQGRPPDGEIEPGTEVELLEEQGSYSLVRLEDGSAVYVESSSLQGAGRGSRRSFDPGGLSVANETSSGAADDHLDEVSLRYGGGQMPLYKSKKYIAVKVGPDMESAAVSDLIPQTETIDPKAAGLGGFQIINVAEANFPMEETLDRLRATSAVREGTHVFHTSDDEVPFVPTGEIYIEFTPDASFENRQELLDKYKLELVGDQAVPEQENAGVIVRITPESSNPVKTAKSLQESPFVKVAEPDLATPGEIQNFVLPSDPRIIDQWHLQNTGFHRGTSLGFTAGADARVIRAWQNAQSLGTPNVLVAVIDDGFDLTHPDLTGDWKIVAPKDFTRNSVSPLPDVLAQDWHGTACAGVAVGNADGAGICGAAPRCRLMPIRWGRDLSARELQNWFDYVRQQGAWVVSCSWKARARVFQLPTLGKRAIERCAREGRGGLGTVICFAAGNDNLDVNHPSGSSINGFAIHPDVIAVAASTSRDQRSNYSNFGKEITICAPSSGAGGWGITTSDVMGQYSRGNQTFEAGYSPGAYTNDFGGTSSACPLVAGICALILSVKPELTAAKVKEIITRTARKIGSPSDYDSNGHSRLYGYGCIDAAAALSFSLEGGDSPQPLWGGDGHRYTNELAISALPGELQPFYALYLNEIVKHAMDADDVKDHDPEERPRHYIDVDLYGGFPFSALPEDYNAAVAKFGESVVKGRGTVPWVIEKRYNQLVQAFKNKNLADVLKHSAWLGHYVGDAHVPLHTTANHNGQLTGQRGLHSYFESRLVEERVRKEDVKPLVGQAITNKPHKLAFSWVRESYSHLQSILDADAANGGKTRKRDLDGFAKVALPIAIDRLAKGCMRTASLWYSAWLEAGQPSMHELSDDSPFAPHRTSDLLPADSPPQIYLPPAGFLADFERSEFSEDLKQLWHRQTSDILNFVRNQYSLASPLFYDQLADTSGVPDSEPQPIPWNGFPLRLRKWFGEHNTEDANRAAEVILNLPVFGLYSENNGGIAPLSIPFRVQDEYCEWHVERDGDAIKRIMFTCEPPEYWEFLAARDFDLVHELYQELLHAEIDPDDLRWQHDVFELNSQNRLELRYRAGDYNPRNVWNTERGAIHLTHPANSLTAEMILASDGTLGWNVNPNAAGNIDEIELMCCAGRGGINRSSDPLIMRGVFNFARRGLSVALANPIGLYMTPFRIDALLDPDGNAIGEAGLKFVRRSEDGSRILRAEIAPPEDAPFTLDQCTYDGNPLVYGGQIARDITMTLFGVAKRIPNREPRRIPRCLTFCCPHPVPEHADFKGTFSRNIGSCDDVSEQDWQNEAYDIPELPGIAPLDGAVEAAAEESSVEPLIPVGRKSITVASVLRPARGTK